MIKKYVKKDILINRLKDRLRILSYFMMLFLISMLIGFYFFKLHMSDLSNEQDICDPNQIIIVITGGTSRIDSAVRLLNNNCGNLMLISGVYSGFNKRYLQQHFSITDDKIKQVFLGYEANNTEGNAKEALIFLALHERTDPILLITNDYHIPRAKLLFKHFIHDRNVNCYAISSNESMVIYFIEYIKYIGTYILYKTEFINQIYISYLQNRVNFWRNL